MKQVRTLGLMVLLLVGMMLLGQEAMASDPVSFDFSTVQGAAIRFPGDGTFAFRHSADTGYAGSDFEITNQDGFTLPDDLLALQGQLNGTFTIGPITTSGGVSTASVTGIGDFYIFDGTDMFSAKVHWVDMVQNGTGNLLNTTGTVNLTSFAYTGSNASLQELAGRPNGMVVVSFQFVPAVSLSVLRNGPGAHETSMSGSVIANGCASALGDFVWNDLNHDGIQQSNEPGIGNITVELWNSDHTSLIATTTTDSTGFYHFNGLCGGLYQVVVPIQGGLNGWVSSPNFAAASNVDSNGIPAMSGTPQHSDTVNLPDNTVENTIDFGYYYAPPMLKVDKTPDNGVFAPGDALTFSIVVTNIGGTPAINAQLNDTLPVLGGLSWLSVSSTQPGCSLSGNQLSCSFGTMQPGASITVTVTSTPTPNMACQYQPNPHAIAKADNVQPVEDAGSWNCAATQLQTTNVNPGTTVDSGDSVTLTVTETNVGGRTITGVSVTGTGCSPWTGGATTLGPGASTDFSCTFNPTMTTNWMATGHGTDSQGNPVPGTNETTNGTVTVIHPATTLTTTDDNVTVGYGNAVTLTVTEKNTGDSDITDVYVSGTGCTPWLPANVPVLGANATATFTCTFTPTTETTTWTAAAHGTDAAHHTAPSAGESTAGVVTVTVHPATTLTTSTGAVTANYGDNVTLTVTETNTGDSPLSNVSVAGTGCTPWTPASVATLAKGATATFTCTLTNVTGTVNWTATATATDAFGHAAPADNESTNGTVTVTIHPATTLTTSTGTVAVNYGGSTILTVTEKNAGDSPISNINVTGTGCVAWTGGSASLNPGQSTNFTCTLTNVTATVNWTATGHGKDVKGNDVPLTNEVANGTVTVTLHPATVLITKTVDPGTSVLSGTTVTLTVKETNTGDSAIMNVNVTGTGCTTWLPASVASLGVGSSADFTCTLTNVTAMTNWTATGHGTDLSGAAVPLTNETTGGTITVTAPPPCTEADFDLTTTNTNTPSYGTFGNIRTFTSNGVSVHASAFSRNSTTNAWSTAYLGQYTPGLGVTDSSEGDGANPKHKVDNIGGTVNYVMFEFSTPVIVDRVFLDAIGVDSDLSVWVGTKTNAYSSHNTLSDSFLTSLGPVEENLTSLTATSRWADINSGAVSGNVLVIAALASDTSPEDEFKISKLDISCAPPPPPCTGAIGDFVWKDINGNGIQDSGEPGIPGITVQLKNGTTVLGTATTDSNGYYKFTGLCAGTYTVTVINPPSGYTASPSMSGPNQSLDSNGSPATVTLTSSASTDMTIDFGYVPVAPPPCVETTFTFTGDTPTSGTAGNIRALTVNGTSVNVSGFSRSTTGTWAKAYLGMYGPGLGVTDNTEGDGANPKHKVDNIGSAVDYVMFEFSAPVTLNKVFLDAIGTDSDISVWIGNVPNAYTAHTSLLSDGFLSGLGAVEENLQDVSATSRWADVNAGNKTGNVIIIAALASDTSPEDEFKISKLDLSCATPPPPCTGSIGNFVWKDSNGNGIQDSGEPGIQGVTVTLKSGSTVVATTVTNTNGYYQFANICGGNYTVVVSNVPYGYTASPSNQGSNRAVDSSNSGVAVTLAANASDQTIDFGFVPPAPPACSQTTFIFTGNSALNGTVGNTRTFTVNGVTVKVTAFSRTTSGVWSKSYLGLYGPGLGVTNNTEDGTAPTHKVDNIGQVDHVLFEFSTPVIINQAFLDAIGQDSDISVWIGSKTDPINNHNTLSDAFLTSLGTVEENTTTALVTSRWADINSNNKAGNVIVISPLRSDTSPEDEFKLNKLDVKCQ